VLRNFLGPIPGVSAWNLAQYVVVFHWHANIKTVTDRFRRCLSWIPLNSWLATRAKDSCPMAKAAWQVWTASTATWADPTWADPVMRPPLALMSLAVD
jgi:hypothetical protein